jgi:hypothetical protein
MASLASDSSSLGKQVRQLAAQQEGHERRTQQLQEDHRKREHTLSAKVSALEKELG